MKSRLFAFVVAMGLATVPVHAETYNLTLTGASPGGLWSRIGGGVDAAIAAAYPGSTITYQTSSGGLANIPMVAGGKVPMGIATDGELTLAVTGQSPFKSSIKDVRALVRLYTPAARFQVTHLLLNKNFADKHGIKTFADIVSKKAPIRVAINRRGNMDADISELVMDLQGATRENIESWGGQVVHAASKEITSLMLDRRIDLANFGISFNHPRVREIAKGVPVIFLEIPESIAQKVVDKVGGEVCTIEPGEYDFLENGSKSICIGTLLIVSKDMDDQTAYNLTKAMFEKIEDFKTNSHRLIAKTATAKTLSQPGIVPFHPGAAKYMKEMGYLM